MSHSFRGGIHPDPHKDETKNCAIQSLAPPELVVIPMSMHIGIPCQPLVQVGDKVRMGQKIGDCDQYLSVPVHASVSGTVKAVAPAPHPTGASIMSVTIENDGLDTPIELQPQDDWQNMTADAITAVIREAGIVGHGGAAFPTHAKIRSAMGRVDTMIINGAECEPYITSDYRIMMEYPEEVVQGIQVLLQIFPGVRCFVAIENNKPEAMESMRRAIGSDARIQVTELKTKYPQGSEKQLIQSVTGREVPPGKLPADTGCVVFNVDTAAAVCRAVIKGMPVIRRIVTVAGSAVTTPKNFRVRIGTLLNHVLTGADGFCEEPKKIIMGGPMMGVSQSSTGVPVMKGTNAVLAFAGNEDRRRENPVCIRCGRCIQVCPMRLLPTYLYLYAMKGNFAECDHLHVTDCMECGACTFECPGSLHLTQTFRMAKGKVMEQRKK